MQVHIMNENQIMKYCSSLLTKPVKCSELLCLKMYFSQMRNKRVLLDWCC